MQYQETFRQETLSICSNPVYMVMSLWQLVAASNALGFPSQCFQDVVKKSTENL